MSMQPNCCAGIAAATKCQPAIQFCSAHSTSLLRSKFTRSVNVSPLEKRIGYKFRNSLLLAEALTHPSVGHETQQYHFDNQRLEFLGDAVLQLVVTEYLFQHFGKAP